jgi:transposase-like protein
VLQLGGAVGWYAERTCGDSTNDFKWRQTEPAIILSAGSTIDFLLSALRGADAAKRLFRKALNDPSHPQPRVINTDLVPIYTNPGY